MGEQKFCGTVNTCKGELKDSVVQLTRVWDS